MTLQVTIKHDQPGYPLTARVQVFDLNDLRDDIDAKPKQTHVLADGESVSLYVYDIQQIIISEGPAQPAADTGMPQAPAIHGAGLKTMPVFIGYTPAQMASMPADGFVQPGEVRSDGTIQTEATLAAARATVGEPGIEPPVDDAFVEIGSTRFSDGQIQTEATLQTAKAVYMIAHPDYVPAEA